MSGRTTNSESRDPKEKRNLARIEAEAASWLARQERGFSEEERNDFASWVFADVRNAATLTELEEVWLKLDGLSALLPPGQTSLDCDFFRPRPRWRTQILPLTFAVAASLAVCFFIWRDRSTRLAEWPAVASAYRHLTLPDGSGVDLIGESVVSVNFTAAERRVVLERGEANFTVAKNAARPFLVSASGVVIRAVGTVFVVSFRKDDVEVDVTEGKVRVTTSSASAEEQLAARLLVAGEHLRVPLGGPLDAQKDNSSSHTDVGLAWQGEELIFVGQPLAAVVEEFNRHSQHKLVIGDSELGAIRVGGKFRADNVEAFVRLLEDGFGISAERTGSEVVLRKAP